MDEILIKSAVSNNNEIYTFKISYDAVFLQNMKRSFLRYKFHFQKVDGHI